MSITINVNNLSLCHRGSGGITIATLPDVCNTPIGGKPVPIPYPNIAYSADLANGTRTITADGGNMCANYGSEFSKSTGDEPGTLGGVRSGTFTKEATWITFSFDVKLEGKGACRLTDKMFQNHFNTVDCAGLLQAALNKIKLANDKKDGCKDILDLINLYIGKGRKGKEKGITGLDERYQVQRGEITNARGITTKIRKSGGPWAQPSNGAKTNDWWGHNQQIADQKRALKKALDAYDEDCKDEPRPPQDAKSWWEKDLPQPSEWRGEAWDGQPWYPPGMSPPVTSPAVIAPTTITETTAGFPDDRTVALGQAVAQGGGSDTAAKAIIIGVGAPVGAAVLTKAVTTAADVGTEALAVFFDLVVVG